MEISALANIEGILVLCKGEIEIHSTSKNQVYYSWRLEYNGNLIASKSANLYWPDYGSTRKELLEAIISKIENYRIGREKVFSQVSLS